MSNRKLGVYLSHALFCIDNIRIYTADGESAFLSDRKTQDAVVRNLEVIGQCVKDAGIDVLQAASPGTDWRAIAAFRNVLAHEYFGVKADLVWAVVADDLPAREQSLNALASSTK